MKKLTLYILNLYQNTLSVIIGVLFGKGCRFSPTCSEYAKEAIGEHGVANGTLLTLSRLSKCHPWGGTGFDPVPKKK